MTYNGCYAIKPKQASKQPTNLLSLSLPGPLCPGVVAPDRALSMGLIELNCVFMLNWIVWNRAVYMYKKMV